MNIFELLRSGADVDMSTPEYVEAVAHMMHCNGICFKINTTEPEIHKIRPLEEQLFDGGTIVAIKTGNYKLNIQ